MDKLLFTGVILIAIFFAIKADKKKNKIYIYISALIFSLVAGLRATSVGIDTKAYYYSFINNFPYSWQFKEAGFRYISNILIYIFKDPVYLMIIYALVTNFFIISRLWDFREKCNFPFMIFLYGTIFFIETLNIMRQFLVISVILYSTKLLERRKYFSFFIIVLIMTTIHKTCLLALLILVICYWNNLSRKNKIIFSAPTFVMIIIGIYVVLKYENDHILNYFSESNKISNLNLTYIYRVIAFVISYALYKSKKSIIFGKKNVNINKEENGMSDIHKERLMKINQITCIYLIGLCLSSMGMLYFVMARLGYYYLIFELLYWGYMTNKYNKNRKINIILISTYALYVFTIELLKNGSGIFPYTTYL